MDLWPANQPDMMSVLPNTALFCIINYYSGPYGDKNCAGRVETHEGRRYRNSKKGIDVPCKCYMMRTSFVPKGTKYFLSKHPNQIPHEAIYEVYIEKVVVREKEDVKEIGISLMRGFDVESSDYVGLEDILEQIKLKTVFTRYKGKEVRCGFGIPHITETKELESKLVYNKNVKKSKMYADVAIDKLISIKMENARKRHSKEEVEKKENPHMTERKKKY